jgi:hypothetical protein
MLKTRVPATEKRKSPEEEEENQKKKLRLMADVM